MGQQSEPRNSDAPLRGRDRQREETRRRVYAAALTIFRRDGVNGCRIEDIATLAGVSRGTFYFHFPTKEDVLLEFLHEHEAGLGDLIDALPESLPLAGVLEFVCGRIAETWEGDPQLLPDVATVALRLNAATVSDRDAHQVRRALTRRFQQASARGELSPILPGELLCDFFLVNTVAAMLAWHANRIAPLGVVLQGVATLFLNGAGGPMLPDAA